MNKDTSCKPFWPNTHWFERNRMTTLELQVAQIEVLNPLIHRLTLRAPAGGALPGFSAGAHVRVQVHLHNEQVPSHSEQANFPNEQTNLHSAQTDWRHYSLVNLSTDPQACVAPDHYTIAVRLEEAGRGGSRFMHTCQPGDTLTVEPPKNDFPLTEHAGRTVLVAGGIGVTPLISMAAQCLAKGQAVRMVYAGRTRALMAYLPELHELLGEALQVHVDTEAGAPLDVNALLDACEASDRLYVCGPQVMLDAVLAAAHARDWPIDRVHFELFTAPVAQAGDHAFEVQLVQSGVSYNVAADQTLLDCLIENGCDPLFDCKRGECGICAVPVIEGEVDHRDYVLTASEKAAGKVIHICISRAKGQRLVLDL